MRKISDQNVKNNRLKLENRRCSGDRDRRQAALAKVSETLSQNHRN
jgi:hypothetical protein